MKSPLVLVSGLLSNERVWEHQIDHLSSAAEILLFNPDQDSAEKMVEAILNDAPPVFALAGHSMGGWLCLEMLRAAPSRVSKLCLLNTTARSDTQEKRARRKEMIARCEAGKFDEVAEEMTHFFTRNRRLRQEIKDMFLKVGYKTFINQEMAMINRKPCTSILPKISCPTLVIHAADDQIFSLEEHIELAGRIPNGKLAIIEDSGHMCPLEMPQAVTSLLLYWLTYF